MAKYLYNDEDNAPMNEEDLGKDDRDCEHCRNYDGMYCTAWDCRFEAKEEPVKEEPLPFSDPPDGCWNCLNFDLKKEACTVNWNNLDESYYNPACDDRKPTDYCENHETDEEAEWEDLQDGNT